MGSSKINGSKKIKERVTVLVCCSMSGEKKKLLVIGNSAKPRRFPKDHSLLPTDYDHSKKAWMNRLIMGRWLTKWNKELRLKGKNILLLLDNAPSHPNYEEISDLNLTNIVIKYLPANTTSICQPADAGIINSLKAHYKRLLRERTIAAMEIDHTEMAYKFVTSETISNCFQNAFKGEKFEKTLENFPLPPNISLESFQAQLKSENEIDCHENFDSEEENDIESVQEIENVSTEVVSTNQFLHHLNSVRSYIQSRGASDTIYNALQDLESIALHDKIENSSKNQTKITHFLLK